MTQFILDVAKEITGDITIAKYTAGFFFSCMGIILSLFFHSLSRDKFSPRTPTKFSVRFLFKDNWQRIIASVILVFLSLRFAPELYNKEFSMFYAAGIGFGLDKVAQLMKNALKPKS